MAQKKVVFAVIFVILAFGAMLVDAFIHLDQVSQPSMALLHGGHGGHGGHVDVAGAGGYITQAELYEMPFVTRNDRIERLPYEVKDGVKEFYLTADEFMWEYAEGKYVHAWGYNNQIPGPEIRVTDGDRVRVIVKNNLPVPTTVHWHGLEVPYQQDGVPGFSQYPIEPGEEYVYEFEAKEAGSRFYHSHGNLDMDSVTQMDMGMSGAFIIEERDPELEYDEHGEPVVYDREIVYLLDEWGVHGPGFNTALDGLASGGHAHGAEGYNTFTINGLIDPYIPPLRLKEGERVLIRLINVGTQEVHPMHLHGHSFRVVALDGNRIPRDQQRTHDVFTVHPSERADIEFVAENPGAWLFHCHHLHHAAGGMVVPVLYEGYEPCCEDQ